MSIEKAKFRKPVIPGDTLILRVDVVQNRGSVWKFDGKGLVNGKVVAESSFSAMIADKKRLVLTYAKYSFIINY